MKRNNMAIGHVVSFGSGSYLSFHDCAAWSRRVGPLALSSAPCLQQLRCPSSATGSGRRPCVASTLCWLADMENTSFPKPQKKSTRRVLSFCGSGSYLSFHDCAAWSFPSGQASSRYGLPVFSSSASPCRSLQPLRPGQPAVRVGPATGSGRRPCVASTLCWLAGMGEIYCFRSKAKSMAFGHAFCFGSQPVEKVQQKLGFFVYKR